MSNQISICWDPTCFEKNSDTAFCYWEFFFFYLAVSFELIKYVKNLLIALEKQAKFQHRFLKGNHSKNAQFQNFSVKLYVFLKDLFNYQSVILKKNTMRDKDILWLDFIKGDRKKFLKLNLFLIWLEKFLFYHKTCFPRKTWVLFVLL